MTEKVTVIPAGYRLTVTTWENDADNYNTKVLEGLSEERIKYLVDLTKMFNRSSNLSNIYDPGDVELKEYELQLVEFAKKYKSILDKDIPDDYDFEEIVGREAILDYIHEDMYDLGICGTEFFTRVVNEFKIEYLSEPIHILDVTWNFK